jgi:hypothetical protein
MIMVTWRCEYRWVLFCWPVACVAWWIGTLGSLWAIARKIEVVDGDAGQKKSWAALLLSGYVVRKAGRGASRASHTDVKPGIPTQISESRVEPSYRVSGIDDEDETLVVRVEFPTEAHYRWWNTAIQTVAVGIYLYATFVLSSVLFLTGNESILYAVGMTLSLSAIRIMSALF